VKVSDVLSLSGSEKERGAWTAIALALDSAQRVWATYMLLYTSFFTANLIAFSWCLTQYNRTPIQHQNNSVMAAIWIFFNLNGVASSTILMLYSRRVNARVSQMLADLHPKFRDDAELLAPKALTTWGAMANGSSLAVNALIWLYILVR
jgi:hypothetical protein